MSSAMSVWRARGLFFVLIIRTNNVRGRTKMTTSLWKPSRRTVIKTGAANRTQVAMMAVSERWLESTGGRAHK